MSFYLSILSALVFILFTTILYLSPRVNIILANLKDRQFQLMIGKSGSNFQDFVEWHTIVHRLERREGRQRTWLFMSFWSSTIGAVISALLIIVSCFGSLLIYPVDFWCKIIVGFSLLISVVGVIAPSNLVLQSHAGSIKEREDVEGKADK